jgi:hypothetical protein
LENFYKSQDKNFNIKVDKIMGSNLVKFSKMTSLAGSKNRPFGLQNRRISLPKHLSIAIEEFKDITCPKPAKTANTIKPEITHTVITYNL